MANSGKKTQKKKTPEKSASACGETIVKEKATGSLPKENGDLRTVIVDVLRNDDAVMQTIIRLGQRHVGPSGEYKPRPIIVKFRSYETRSSVFSAKRRLKGTKYVVTENLTRRRNDLLKKVRSLDTVSCAWTTDGRIICLLGDGRKVTVLHERDIDTLSTGR